MTFILLGWAAIIVMVISNLSAVPLLRIFKEKAPEIYVQILGVNKIGPIERGCTIPSDTIMNLRLEKTISVEKNILEIKKRKIYYLFKIAINVLKIIVFLMALIVIKVTAIIIYGLIFRPWEIQ